MRRRLAILTGLVVIVVAVSGLSGRVSAWWPDGHAATSGAALDALPADMPAFFRSGARTLSLHSAMPDVWTESGLARLRAAERHGHYVDLELLQGNEPPPTRAEYAALAARLGQTPEAVGTLPYAIAETCERLVVAFAVHRSMPEDEAARAEALYLGGILSHYAADACQPLHTTVHFDGRAGPDGSSLRTGVHMRVDALLANAGLARGEVARGLEVAAVEDAFACALAAVREAHALVDGVYALEERLPAADGGRAAALDPEVRAFALERSRAAARLVATLWYSAWRASEGVKLPEWFPGFAGRLRQAGGRPGCAAP